MLFKAVSKGSLKVLRRIIRLPFGSCFSWPVARRRNAGLPLCADACLLFAGLSHENWPGEKMRCIDQSAQIDYVSIFTGGNLN